MLLLLIAAELYIHLSKIIDAPALLQPLEHPNILSLQCGCSVVSHARSGHNLAADSLWNVNRITPLHDLGHLFNEHRILALHLPLLLYDGQLVLQLTL